MDIMAKRMTPTQTGYKVATLSVEEYRKQLWNHHRLRTSGRLAVAMRLSLIGWGFTPWAMSPLARWERWIRNTTLPCCSHIFGTRAELLIDHAWGNESITIQDIKRYQPAHQSLSVGQVLPRPYAFSEGITIIDEMAAELASG